MSWSKSFTIASGTDKWQAEDIIRETEVPAQPNSGYDPETHKKQVDAAKDAVIAMLGPLEEKVGKDISVTIGGHTACGKDDWGSSMSASICHVTPQKPTAP